MEVQDINKQLTIREKLSNLSEADKKIAQEAIKAGLDVTNLSNEQLEAKTKEFAENNKIQGQMTDIGNAFKGIAATVGGVLLPVIQVLGVALKIALAPIQMAVDALSAMAGWLKSNLDIIAVMATTFGLIVAWQERSLILETLKNAQILIGNGLKLLGSGIEMEQLGILIGKMAAAAFTSLAEIPFIGPILGAAAAASAYALGRSYFHKASDVNSPSDGKTQISTKEGGLYELSPNDDLVAAPGASKALAGGGGATGGGNLAALAAPLNAMIGEIKALRADLTAGKVAVYMDGVKLTNGIGKQAERTSRNNFNMSQA